MTRPGVRLPRTLRTAAHPPWTELAACGEPGVDPALFYSEPEDEAPLAKRAAAKSICARCPVTAECGDYGDRVSPAFGIFAGRTVNERKRAREARVAA